MKGLQLSSELATRILEEWVYVQLRIQVDNNLDLKYVEREIEDAVRAAMGVGGERLVIDRDDPPSRVLTATLIGRAWQRIADEWSNGDIAAVEHEAAAETEVAS